MQTILSISPAGSHLLRRLLGVALVVSFGVSQSTAAQTIAASESSLASVPTRFSEYASDTAEASNAAPITDENLLKGIFAASRLASRATFGVDLASIEYIDNIGEEAWLETQFSAPVTYHDPFVDDLMQRMESGDFDEVERVESINNLPALFGRIAWWHVTVSAQDQLRQRVAYALSQILVVSDNVNALFLPAYATSNFYDTLLEHAFGNFRELLLEVTLHPSMGVFLSHMNNARSDPQAGTFPDENYAREVMQLFTIGLFELNPDGSETLDADGRPVPTYDNQDIGEFAKIFTGLSWGGAYNRFGSNRYNFLAPMRMFDEFHEPGEKLLLRGQVVPAGQSGIEDIEAAVDNLFYHPNVGPFIGRRLIQRLVSSNPSPSYIERVATVFNDNGQGERGDMQAVLRAVLLDPEARAMPKLNGSQGKLREPLLRYTAMLRKLGVSSPDGFYASTGQFVQQRIQQHPLSAPSVFNFYLPDHQPIGELSAQSLVAPEFQITNSNSIIEISNLMQFAVMGDFVNELNQPPFAKATLSLGDYVDVAKDTDALLDRLDTVFTYGTLSGETRAEIRDLLILIDDWEQRVRVAAYLLLISPDFAVEI
ncbi:MAG: DUF1800 family protein [Congregibacter sp.]